LGETLLFTDHSYVQANALNNAAHEAIIDHFGQLIHEIISNIFRGVIAWTCSLSCAYL
jgi:hypothetical protein